MELSVRGKETYYLLAAVLGKHSGGMERFSVICTWSFPKAGRQESGGRVWIQRSTIEKFMWASVEAAGVYKVAAIEYRGEEKRSVQQS